MPLHVAVNEALFVCVRLGHGQGVRIWRKLEADKRITSKYAQGAAVHLVHNLYGLEGRSGG